MLCVLCCIILLDLPTIQPVSVQIDGSFDVSQNFKFEHTPILPIGRTINDSFASLPPDVAAILRNFTVTTSPAVRQSEIPLMRSATDAKDKVIHHSGNHKQISNEEDPVVVRITRPVYETVKTKKERHRHNTAPRNTAREPSVRPTFPTGQDNLRDYDKGSKYPPKKGSKFHQGKHHKHNKDKNRDQRARDDENKSIYFDEKDDIDDDARHSPDTSEPHFVKDDLRIQEFTLDVFKQNLGVFDAIKSKSNDTQFKNKIDFIVRSYRNKFGEFVNDTQHRKVVTRLGTQKVVLNIIETSNRITRRLMNFLLGDMENKGALRDKESVANTWRILAENEEQQEYVKVCQSFNICSSKYTLSNFMADYFTILLQVDDRQLKQAIDALTEVLRETDLSKVMDKKLQTQFESNIDAMERAEPNMIRPMLWMFRNMLVDKNQPMVVQEKVPKKVVNQSVAILDVIDMLDERIAPTDENMLEWNDLRNSLVQWGNGQRNDILEIMQTFVKMMVKKGVKKMNTRVLSNFRDRLKVVLRGIWNW